jgi:uncharacterized OsmC-like protein
MAENSLQEEQAPLKEQYEENPETAQVTLSATGTEQADVRSCDVDIGRAVYEAELHEGAAGPGTGACSGDLLLGALAACAQLTAQAVADAFGLDVSVETEVSGDLDLRGTLGIDEDAPVGFEGVRMETTVEGEVDAETATALQRATEKYCVVYQTLASAPTMETDWTFDGEYGED